MPRMRGRGGKRLSSSARPTASHPPTYEVDQNIEDEDDGETLVNGGLGLPTLDPAGLWFHIDEAKKAVREAKIGKFDTFAPSWFASSDEQKEAWWNHFKCRFQYKKRHEDSVYDMFADRCTYRLRDMVYRAGVAGDTSNDWMDDSVREDMMKYRSTKRFFKKSGQCKLARLAHSQDGKPNGTHTMGRRNSIQLMDAMFKETGRVPTVTELVTRAKTKKRGGLFSSRAVRVLDDFTSMKSEALQTQPPEEVDDNQIYLKAAGGINKKGVVFGMGQASNMFYERCGKSSGKEGYAPGLVTQLTQEKIATAKRMDDLEAKVARMDDLEAQLAALSKAISSQNTVISTLSCNPNVGSIQEDDFDDEGEVDVEVAIM